MGKTPNSGGDLISLHENWEALAQDDALWAVLTDDAHRYSWDEDSFLRSGEQEIATMWDRLSPMAMPDVRLPALDFGCGAGRLTQALAGRMRRCVGVDIAPTMVQTAQRLNRTSNCSFVINDSRELPFDDATFGLVYSSIVLQHMRPEYASGYIDEFLRVTAPEGLVVFGIPDCHIAPQGLQQVRERIVRRGNRARSRLAIGTRLRRRSLSIERESTSGRMEMHAVPEVRIRDIAAARGAEILDVAIINSADRDFNGNLRYLAAPPESGWVSKQFTIRVH